MNKKYVLKWIIQRVTAFFLIPLSFWFIYQCVSFQNYSFYELQQFFQSYFNSFLFTVMMIAMLVHAKLGCETIIQDYVKTSYLKKIFKRFINFITFFSLLLVFIAIIRLNII